MNPDWFAARLISGAPAGTRKTSWWPRHAMDVARLLCALRPGLRAPREAHHAWCVEWESMVGRGRGLMVEHGFLETALMEAAARKDAWDIERTGDLMVANVRAQVELHGSGTADFPATTYTRLLDMHVRVLVESVRMKMAGDTGSLEQCHARSRQNALALAAFTAEWF